MGTYIAMLRGINVSGHKIIKMEQLRESLEALALQNVRTYVQSGNVVFQTPEKSSENLAKKIASRILSDFGFSVPVLVKAAREIQRTIQKNPFLKNKKF